MSHIRLSFQAMYRILHVCSETSYDTGKPSHHFSLILPSIYCRYSILTVLRTNTNPFSALFFSHHSLKCLTNIINYCIFELALKRDNNTMHYSGDRTKLFRSFLSRCTTVTPTPPMISTRMRKKIIAFRFLKHSEPYLDTSDTNTIFSLYCRSILRCLPKTSFQLYLSIDPDATDTNQ